jgi:hypothetical protein
MIHRESSRDDGPSRELVAIVSLTEEVNGYALFVERFKPDDESDLTVLRWFKGKSAGTLADAIEAAVDFARNVAAREARQ